jgi:hypothetical protein
LSGPESGSYRRGGRQMAHEQHMPPPSGAHRGQYMQPTGWVGWVVFAGVVMIVMGIYHAITGLVALFNRGFYLVGSNGLVVDVNFSAWGWTHLILGILVAAAGISVMAGQLWARVIGIVLAVLSAILNLSFLPAYPLWSVLIIALDVIVIYALAVHGSEMAAE